MSRYIDADDFFRTFSELDIEPYNRFKTADVVPVVHGHWVIERVDWYEMAYGANAYEPVYKCSCCGMRTESYLRFDEPIMPEDASFPDYCGHCGAKMDEVIES